MAGQPTAASLQQSGTDSTEQEELLGLQSRWLDLQLSAESQNIDFGVWNVMFLEISKVSLPQQITRLGRLLHQLEAHLLNRAKKHTESAYGSSVSEALVDTSAPVSNLNAASGSTSESARWQRQRSSGGQSGGD